MIVSVCADKGAPGVTTLVTVLGMVWPGERVVLEADTSGGDLAFRAQHADGDRLLDPQPSVMALAADARGTLPAGGLACYAQPTTWGAPVIPGALTAEAFTPLVRLWPRVADAAQAWAGVAIADLGRFQPGDVALPVARASTAVLLLVRPDLEGLYRLRERVVELAGSVGTGGSDRSPVAVVVRSKTGGDGRAAVSQVRQVLESIGSPVPIAGVFAEDPAAVTAMRAGPQGTRKLLGSDLVTSSRALATTLIAWWPQLQPARPASAATEQAGPQRTVHMDVST